MKAVIMHKHGGPEVLEYTDVKTPAPGLDQIQIEIKSIAMNRLDLWVRDGWPGIKLKYPHILGADAAGVVSAVGDYANGSSLQVGQRVVLNSIYSDGTCEFCLTGQDNLCSKGGLYGEHAPGTYGQYFVAPARSVMPLPDDVSFETASAASLVYITAWHSLIEKGQLQAGETVLVVGAGGGVNTASIQIAKLAGAKVFVVGSTDEKLEQAASLGADVLINREKEDWSKAVFKLTEKRGVDVVVDNVGHATLFGSIRAVRRGGRILIVGNTSGPNFDLDIRYLHAKHISIIGSTMGTQKTFRDVMSLVFEGKLSPIIHKTFSLSDARAAHEHFDSGALFGKVMLEP